MASPTTAATARWRQNRAGDATPSATAASAASPPSRGRQSGGEHEPTGTRAPWPPSVHKIWCPCASNWPIQATRRLKWQAVLRARLSGLGGRTSRVVGGKCAGVRRAGRHSWFSPARPAATSPLPSSRPPLPLSHPPVSPSHSPLPPSHSPLSSSHHPRLTAIGIAAMSSRRRRLPRVPACENPLPTAGRLFPPPRPTDDIIDDSPALTLFSFQFGGSRVGAGPPYRLFRLPLRDEGVLMAS